MIEKNNQVCHQFYVNVNLIPNVTVIPINCETLQHVHLNDYCVLAQWVLKKLMCLCDRLFLLIQNVEQPILINFAIRIK